MIKIMFNIPNSTACLEQAITGIIKSVAMEESALTNIIHLERILLQKANNVTGNIEEFVSINESVNKIMRKLTKLQMLMQLKYQYAEELLQAIGKTGENDGPENPHVKIKDLDEYDELEE